MAHLNAKTYGFVNLQEKLQKNSFKIQNLRQKFLMIFPKLTDSDAVKIKPNVQNCALSTKRGHFEHFLKANVSMEMEE